MSWNSFGPFSDKWYILNEKSIFSYRDSLPDDMSVKDYKTSTDIAFDFILKQKLIELPIAEFWCILL
jgi:hypothetical protein